MSNGRDDRSTVPVIDEAMLHAYADNQLAAAQRATVEAWLADHPPIAEEVRDWQAQNEALHAAFDPVLEQPIPPALAALGERRRAAAAPRWRLLAAGLLLFVLGGVAGWLAPGQHPFGRTASGAQPGFVADATAAYRLYTVEVRHPVEVGADQEQHLVAWLSKRLGSHIAAPHLADQGFHLVGGRLLPGSPAKSGQVGSGQVGPGQTTPAAMLMYEDAAGRRVTCYVVTNTDTRETAFQFRQMDGVSTFFWIDSGLSYALSGEVGRDKLLALAQEVYRQLN
jgi:anti-sigma factor RsiW